MPEERKRLNQPVEIDRETISKNKLPLNIRSEVRELRSLMQLTVARRSVDARRPIRYRHQRAAQLFHMRPRRAEIPAALVNSEAFYADPWWTRKELDHGDDEPDPNTPIRADGSKLIREIRYKLQLLDGRNVTQIRQVFVSKTGRRFKEFYVAFSDGTKTPFGDIPHGLLPLYGIDSPTLPQGKLVVVCEGISATEELSKRGISAVGTLTGALGTPARLTLEPLLRQQGTVYLWPDNDDVGVQHMERVAQRLHDLGVQDIRVIHWVGAPRKADAANFKGNNEDVQNLIKKAQKWVIGNRPRHRGILAVNPPIGGMRLQLPQEERPLVPRLGNKLTPIAQRQDKTKIITELESMLDQELLNNAMSDEIRDRITRLLTALRASIGDLSNNQQEEENNDANSNRR